MENGQETSSSVSFSQEQIDFICAVEQLWWENGALPTSEAISELTGISATSVKGYWALEHVRSSLLKRGVDLESRTGGVLTIQQLDCVNRMLNPHDKRSLREKLSEIGISTQKYEMWLREPAFQNYIERRVASMWQGTDSEAYMTLMGAVRGGSLEAVKLFFEMRGIYNPRLQLDVNVDGILAGVIEVITRHVTDPVVLQAIAEDLDLLNPQTGRAPVLSAQRAIEATSFSI